MDMKKMMREAQKMQAEMAKAQDEIAQMTVEGTAGGGVVKVVATGNLAVESVTIDPSVIDPDDADMLQDLVLAAVNEALRQAKELANTRMNAITGGIGLPF
jgi:DNA-binding YbaB/EbfC family protein